jgi:hypothetical protein
MDKNMNKKAKFPQAVSQPPKTASVSSPQSILDVPRPRPIAVSAALAHEEIAKRAYQIYVEKGYPQGQSEQNWLQAEQEQRSRGLATLLSR